MTENKTALTREEIGQKIDALYEAQHREVMNGNGVGDYDFDEIDKKLEKAWKEYDAA